MQRDKEGKFSRMYKVNHQFFDEINTEEKAYILGFLYADGTNQEHKNGGKYVSFTQLEQDKDILEKINISMGSNYPLYESIQESNGKLKYKLSINSQQLSNTVSRLGAVPNKSLILKFPDTSIFKSKDLIRHFIRGYFDGDGSVSGDKQKQFCLVGTIDFLLPLQQILIEELGFSETKLEQRHKDRDNNIRSLRYCGVIQCITFRDWLYKDTTIYLERKKKIFDSYKPFIRTERKCAVEGCDIKHFGKGYCRNHYYQFCGGKEKRRERFIKTRH